LKRPGANLAEVGPSRQAGAGRSAADSSCIGDEPAAGKCIYHAVYARLTQDARRGWTIQRKLKENGVEDSQSRFK
jgi:hypothetical protein